MEYFFSADTGNSPEQNKRLRITTIKAAAFALILFINQNFLYNIFLYPAVMLNYALDLSENGVYVLNWLFNDLCAYVFPMIAAYLLFRKEREYERSYAYSAHGHIFPLSIMIFCASCFLGSLTNIIAEWIADIFDKLFGTGELPDVMTEMIPSDGSVFNFVIFMIFVGILAPICEEIIFRGFLLRGLRSCGNGFAIVISALLFGAYHGNFGQLPYAFTVGLLYGWLACASNSLLPTLILHAVNNALVTAGNYAVALMGENDFSLAVSDISAQIIGIVFWIGIPAAVLFFTLKICKFKDAPQFKGKDIMRELLKNPAFYIMILFMALLMADFG